MGAQLNWTRQQLHAHSTALCRSTGTPPRIQSFLRENLASNSHMRQNARLRTPDRTLQTLLVSQELINERPGSKLFSSMVPQNIKQSAVTSFWQVPQPTEPYTSVGITDHLSHSSHLFWYRVLTTLEEEIKTRSAVRLKARGWERRGGRRGMDTGATEC
jgi:hypothetical protein